MFPAFTVCPTTSYKENVLKENGIASIDRYNNKYNLTWSSNDPSISNEQLFNMVTYDVEEIVESVKIRLLEVDVCNTIAVKANYCK